jgi:hypothetical protein
MTVFAALLLVALDRSVAGVETGLCAFFTGLPSFGGLASKGASGGEAPEAATGAGA